MISKVDPDFRLEIMQLGGDELNRCIHCGNCTAVCALTEADAYFPRRIIRYAQLGMKDRLLGEKDIWLCYYCGECSLTCPRQADPGEIMAAVRRYAISQYDPTGISRWMYRSAFATVAIFTVLSSCFTLFLLWHRGDLNGNPLGLFDFIPGKLIHDTGIVIFILTGLLVLAGIGGMIRQFFRIRRLTGASTYVRWSALPTAIFETVVESLGQRRYRSCDADSQRDPVLPLYLQPWFVHATIFWGFLGLLAATTLDFLFKDIGSYIPIWHPFRLLGTAAGLVCCYGASVALWQRSRKPTNYYAKTQFSDLFLLVLLLLAVVTGFVTESIVYLPHPTLFGYVVFVVHVVLAMDLIVLLPLTKLSHVIYRPVGLMLHRWLDLSQPSHG